MLRKTELTKQFSNEFFDAANNVGLKKYRKFSSTVHEFTFDSISHYDPKPSIAVLLQLLVKNTKIFSDASNHSSDFITNPLYYGINIHVESSEHKEFELALLFIDKYKLVNVLKENIGVLTSKDFEKNIAKAAQKAQEIYSPLPTAPSVVNKIDLFGINGIIRSKKTANRFEAEREKHLSDAETLLALLQDNATGKSLRSYRYALASALLNITVETDEEAANLIQLVRNEISRKFNSETIKNERKSEKNHTSGQ